MIEDKIKVLANGFVDFWNSKTKDSLKYKLDYTWPSISIIDFLLSDFYYKTQLSDVEKFHLQGAAAYIGGIAEQCWSFFPENHEVKLKFKNEEIIIESYTNELKNYSVNISKSLSLIIQEPKEDTEYIIGQCIDFNTSPQFFKLFSLGLIFGYTGFGEGVWNSKTSVELEERFRIIKSLLAKTSAKFYSQRYFNEKEGTKHELYELCFILPPILFNKQVFSAANIINIINYLKGIDTNLVNFVPLLKNLSKNPDNTISLSASILYYLISSDTTSDLLIQADAIIEAYPSIYATIVFARNCLNKENSLYYLMLKNKYQQIDRTLHRDYLHRYFPLGGYNNLVYESNYFKNLLEFQLNGDVEQATDYLEKSPLNDEALNQERDFLLLKFYLLQGWYSKFQNLFTDLRFTNLSTTELKNIYVYFSATNLLISKQFEESYKLLTTINFQRRIDAFARDVNELLLNILIGLNDKDKINKHLNSEPCSFSITHRNIFLIEKLYLDNYIDEDIYLKTRETILNATPYSLLLKKYILN